MADGLHVIFSAPPEGFSTWVMTSPQIPGLVAGRNTLPELLDATEEILDYAGASVTDIQDATVFIHEEHAAEDPEGREYLIRWQSGTEAKGPDEDARYETATRVHASVHDGFDETDLEQQPLLATGERLFIVALGTDTIGWVADQLREGQGVTLANYVGNDAVYYVPFGEGMNVRGRRALESLGLSRDSTISQVIDGVLASEAADLFKPHASSTKSTVNHRITSV